MASPRLRLCFLLGGEQDNETRTPPKKAHTKNKQKSNAHGIVFPFFLRPGAVTSGSPPGQAPDGVLHDVPRPGTSGLSAKRGSSETGIGQMGGSLVFCGATGGPSCGWLVWVARLFRSWYPVVEREDQNSSTPVYVYEDVPRQKCSESPLQTRDATI